MTPILARRIARLERDQARIAEREQALRKKERAERTRRLIAGGAFLEKVGLLTADTEAPVLYGALLTLQAGMSDDKTVTRWRKAGADALAHDEAERAKLREVVIAEFPSPVPGMSHAALRAVGLRQNKAEKQRWEGEAVVFAEAEPLVASMGGSARRPAAPGGAAELPVAAE